MAQTLFQGTQISNPYCVRCCCRSHLIVLAGPTSLDIPWRDKWALAQAKQGTALVISYPWKKCSICLVAEK